MSPLSYVPPAFGEGSVVVDIADVAGVIRASGYALEIHAIYGVVTSLAMDNKRGLVVFAVQHAVPIMEPSGCVLDRAR